MNSSAYNNFNLFLLSVSERVCSLSYSHTPLQHNHSNISNSKARLLHKLYVHTRSELSYQIAGSHSLSMGKSDQSDQRYQRPKLSDQSVQKKLKTVELYANYYDAFQRQNTDSQSECRRSLLAWIPGNTEHRHFGSY